MAPSKATNVGQPRVVRLGDGTSMPYPMPSSPSSTAVMRANRGRDTSPELAVRRLLHARGHRYCVHLRLSGDGYRVRPDITFTRRKVAVFIDGCFWHGCPAHGSSPRSNSAYWAAKIRSNRERDERNNSALQRAGWLVVRAWEHEQIEEVVRRVEKALRHQAHR